MIRTAMRWVVPVLLCFLAGAIGSVIQENGLAQWYPTLQKSLLTPPAIVFPIVWSVLYACIGLAAGVVLTGRGGAAMRTHLMRVWTIQLLCNFLWSVLFFFLRSPFLGFVDLLLLDLLVYYFILRSWYFRRAAAWLFIPYLGWLLLATYLNGFILLFN